MSEIDIDENGEVSYEEFIPTCFNLLVERFKYMVMQNQALKSDDALESALIEEFAKEDSEDAQGFITPNQIRRALQRLSDDVIGLTKLQVLSVLSAAEVDQFGKVDYVQFSSIASGIIWKLVDSSQQQMRVFAINELATRLEETGVRPVSAHLDSSYKMISASHTSLVSSPQLTSVRCVSSLLPPPAAVFSAQQSGPGTAPRHRHGGLPGHRRGGCARTHRAASASRRHVGQFTTHFHRCAPLAQPRAPPHPPGTGLLEHRQVEEVIENLSQKYDIDFSPSELSCLKAAIEVDTVHGMVVYSRFAEFVFEILEHLCVCSHAQCWRSRAADTCDCVCRTSCERSLSSSVRLEARRMQLRADGSAIRRLFPCRCRAREDFILGIMASAQEGGGVQQEEAGGDFAGGEYAGGEEEEYQEEG